MKKITIYTDGACSGNPGPGGWGAILSYNKIEKEIAGSELYTTNNQMELRAAIEAISLLKEPCEVTLYSDSSYLIKGMNEWLNTWKNNNWKNSNKKSILNKELWEELDRLNCLHTIHWKWVKGHAENEYNNKCDKLAREMISNTKI